ncbi:MAG: isoleucine--tRNA ligase [Clostridia bacterium]|nr:isoleucine--tRNA ligase [Clostridia bacterium]
MYRKVSTNLNFVEREHETLRFWNENKIFEKSMNMGEERPAYTFYDGPPTANGKPHIGHVLTRVIKDMIPRYHTMKGANVPRKAGWDTHGLPVEIEVEKLLGLDGKEQIEGYGLAPFIDKCKESVWKYKGMWEDFSETVGFWADMENPYVTYDNNFIESEWWALKQIYDKGLLYKGFKIVPYCPRCGTPLSAQEVAQGYKDVKERSAIAKFKVKGEENTYFLAWTTTPWTLPSNVALCVNPNETYVKVKTENEIFILAEALAGKHLGEEIEVLETYTGHDLEYKEYEPLFDFVSPREKCWYVTCDNYVTLTDGTGIVHIAPAFGDDDSKVGRAYGLPFVQLVDSKGEMTAETPWAGTFCKKADPEVLKNLKERGLLFSAPPFEHSYPHCWRCDTPLIYYARESWYIKMTDVKNDLVRNNNTVNWIPESIGKGRFGDWLENVQDWAISRNRYWGTPLNIWECSCGHRHSIGSIEELKSMSDNCPENIELHRPYIDEVTIKCPECGGEMHRVPEVIDCWFDSGSMPFAQHHYPFENKELFDAQFPADFISEAVDQTRGWFYSLMAISTLLFNKAPYKNVIVLGHVQDEFGQKMSKSKGNAVDPFDALKTYGADAIRWYFYTNSAPWLPSKFSGKAVVEGQRKFMGTLWNTYAFWVLYANIDKFVPTKYDLAELPLSVMDKYILSRLNTTVKNVDKYLGEYKIPESAKALYEFVDELSNWYVRRCRERFWVQEMPDDKAAAYMTLYHCLVTIAKASAPMVPFMTEDIYQNLVRTVDASAPESIHLCGFPVADESAIDADLERDMKAVVDIIVMGRSARNGANVKNRQPLSAIYVRSAYTPGEYFIDIIREELNLKSVVFVTDASEFSTYNFKPQLRTVGPKYGKFLGKIKSALAPENLDGNAAKRELDENGKIVFDFDGNIVELTPEDLLIDVTQKDGYFCVAEGDVTVALDITLTSELIDEGFVREIISKIQTMRKDSDFVVTDRIKIFVDPSDKIREIFEKSADKILPSVLGTEYVISSELPEEAKAWDINGENVRIYLTRE